MLTQRCPAPASPPAHPPSCPGPGYSDEVLRYASKMFATTEKAYPYTSGSTGTTTSCKVASTATAPSGSLKLSGFSYVASNPDAIMQAIVNTGPVVTYFNVKASEGSDYRWQEGGVCEQEMGG